MVLGNFTNHWFTLGYVANKLYKYQNPYEVGTTEYLEWDKGWEQKRVERNEIQKKLISGEKVFVIL